MNGNTKRADLIVLLLIGVLLAACGGTAPSTTLESPLGTPAPGAALTQPAQSGRALPTPASTAAGTVGGVMIRDQAGTPPSAPIADTKLFLAKVLRSKDGTAMVAGIDEKNSPNTTTDANGAFVFTDIPAETYGIAVSTALGPYLIKNQQGRDFLLTVKGGEVLDLGEVHTSLPY